MNRFAWLLVLPYVVTFGSHTYHEVFVSNWDAKSDVRFECGNDEESCADLSAALNEAHWHRMAVTKDEHTPGWYPSTGHYVEEDKPLAVHPLLYKQENPGDSCLHCREWEPCR